MAVANRLGLRVPHDLSVVGFDNTPSALIAWPPLTTVRQPITEMAAAATTLLLSGEAAQRSATGGAPAHRMLDFEIVQRESAAPPRDFAGFNSCIDTGSP
jgi:LacI family transcriptional regulator